MSRYDLTRDDLALLLEGEPSYRVEQVWEGIHRQAAGPAELTVLPSGLRRRLETEPAFALAWRVATTSVSDESATVKLLLDDGAGSQVETVVMRYADRATVCVSSQAGCAMGCTFCATGQLGYGRQLSVGEIVEQVVLARQAAAAAGWGRVGNVVFMGMGEPLANADRVLSAVRRINGDLGIGARSITISTVGVVPGIRRVAAEPLQVTLAVSLHAANDDLRSRLVPLNRRYPLAEVARACEDYTERTHRRITFEWACIAGVNDRMSDARELAQIAKPLGAHVNLIPLNPTPGYLVAGSSAASVERFRDELGLLGVNATVRDTRGSDVDAACGQLAAGMRRRQVAPVRHLA
jgi:23S rRNA (adenine2503-C2)-methyltransferase